MNNPLSAVAPSNVGNLLSLQGDWINTLKRWFIPKFASQQDQKVSEFFINHINQHQESYTSETHQVLSLADQHIAQGKSWLFFSKIPTHLARLEHYLFSARQRINIHDPFAAQRKAACQADNQELLTRWNKLGFAEEAFWTAPDLVDVVFKTHLHRHVTHPTYKHTIQMQQSWVARAGQVTALSEPHLFMEGRSVPWSEIRQRLKVDADDRFYSLENNEKKYWIYLDQGFTPCDKFSIDKPQRFCKLSTPPLQSRIELVTSHAHQNDWGILDRVLKGNRHTFFRIVPGQGFAQRHPELGLEDGGVYSFGWSIKWRDFSFFRPLSTLRGRWFSPDNFEFYKNDLWVTPIDVSDEKIIQLFTNMKKRNKELHPYHPFVSNCCGGAAEVLNEAGITQLCPRTHLGDLVYKFVTPKILRKPIRKLSSFAASITPTFIAQAWRGAKRLAYSLVFAPLYSVLGAWRTHISLDEGEKRPGQPTNASEPVEHRVKALFSNVFDLFQANKMELDLTSNIYKWQKKQSGTYLEKHN